jgi:hypothetical protein
MCFLYLLLATICQILASFQDNPMKVNDVEPVLVILEGQIRDWAQAVRFANALTH